MATDPRLIDYLKSTGLFFNPKLVYEGEYFLLTQEGMDAIAYTPEHDILMLNSKSEKGQNLYSKFVEKYFFNPIGMPEQLKKSKGFLVPAIVSRLNAQGDKRELSYSYLLSLIGLIEDTQVLANLPSESTEEELLRLVREQLRTTRKQMADARDNGKSSPYYENTAKRLTIQGLPVNKTSIQLQIDGFSQLITLLRGIEMAIKSKRFNIEEFISCFDLDQLCLIFCRSIITDTHLAEKNTNQVGNGLVEVLNYITVSKQMKNYNPSIRIYDPETKKIIRYTLDDLKREVDAILKRHPEFQLMEVSYEEAVKSGITNNAKAAEDFAKRYFELMGTDGLTANWELIQKGEIDASERKERSKPQGPKEPQDDKDLDEELQKKLMVFSRTNFSYKIVGINKFAGYIGFIYPNGLVIFEKFYEDSKTRTPAKGSNATYIMNIDNFIKMSKLSKPEIMQYIKDTENPDIRRIYHSKKWEERLINIINGIDYDPKVEAIIDTLISSQTLQPDKAKKV